MSESKPAVPSEGKGGTIQVVCMAMIVLSLAGGIVGAAQFSKVPVVGYGSYARMEHSPELVIYWLAGGAASAALWFVLSGIGTLIQWLEYDRLAGDHPDSAAPMPLKIDSPAAPEMPAEVQPITTSQSDVPIVITEEQMEARRRAASNARILMAAIFIAIGVAFYFAVFARL